MAVSRTSRSGWRMASLILSSDNLTAARPFVSPTQNPFCFFMQQFLNFLPLPQGHGSFRPTFCLAAGLRGRVRRGDGGTVALGLGHVSRLLAGQLFEGEQQQPLGSPSSSLTLLQCSSFSAFLGRQPLVVLGEPLPHERAGFQQVIPQVLCPRNPVLGPRAVAVRPRFLPGRTGTRGHGPVPLRMPSSFSCASRLEALFHGQIGMDVFQRAGGVEAKMLFGSGECLGNGVQHGGRADSGQGLGTLLVEKVAASSWSLATIRGIVDSRWACPANRTTSGSSHFMG